MTTGGATGGTAGVAGCALSAGFCSGAAGAVTGGAAPGGGASGWDSTDPVPAPDGGDCPGTMLVCASVGTARQGARASQANVRRMLRAMALSSVVSGELDMRRIERINLT
jgi:hypothetical protein